MSVSRDSEYVLTNLSDDIFNLISIHRDSLGSNDDADVFDLHRHEFRNLCANLRVLVELLVLSQRTE